MTRQDFANSMMVIFSLSLLLWGFRLFRHPEVLTPDKFLYQWLYNRFFSLTESKNTEKIHLTTGQIKGYAIFVMLVSVFGVAYWTYELIFF